MKNIKQNKESKEVTFVQFITSVIFTILIIISVIFSSYFFIMGEKYNLDLNQDCEDFNYSGYDSYTKNCFKYEKIYFTDSNGNQFYKEVRIESNGTPIKK